jgi:glycosyltransferase involved in cell wall biosynthesis
MSSFGALGDACRVASLAQSAAKENLRGKNSSMRSDASIRYSLVVPFFNEQENIPQLYMKLTEVMDAIGEPYEMVFVDDGSKDNTYKVLSDIYEHDRRVNVVRLRRNFGQTPALKAGFDFARG